MILALSILCAAGYYFYCVDQVTDRIMVKYTPPYERVSVSGEKELSEPCITGGRFFLCKSMTMTLMTPTYFTREMEK